ncbi:MAG: MoxR family ATPase [Oscillospiraceae bacterium]|nr:MoxR family ATPase [Oscillospiraceae bacterium]
MNAREFLKKTDAEVSKTVVGKSDRLRLATAAVLAGGHILLDDLPGVGKTTFVKSFSMALGCGFKRIQFTPDLLPSDVVGMNIFDRGTSSFRRVDGPIMTNILLADELNRAIPRTQSALLEAMAERQVTLDGETTPLPSPFIVMATQNPVESESTFRLPAAQLDRFMLCLSLGYLNSGEEAEMLRSVGDDIPFDSIRAVSDPDSIVALQEQMRDVSITEDMTDYIVSLVSATRGHPMLRLGASPRATRDLYRCSKALAAISNRDFVTPDDVHELLIPVLAHRLVQSSEAGVTGKTKRSVLLDIAEKTPVPPSRNKLFV